MGSGLLLLLFLVFLLRQVGGVAVGNGGRKLQLSREVTTPQLGATLGSHFHKWDCQQEAETAGDHPGGGGDVSSRVTVFCHMWVMVAATTVNNAAWASFSAALDINSTEWVIEWVSHWVGEWKMLFAFSLPEFIQGDWKKLITYELVFIIVLWKTWSEPGFVVQDLTF